MTPWQGLVWVPCYFGDENHLWMYVITPFLFQCVQRRPRLPNLSAHKKGTFGLYLFFGGWALHALAYRWRAALSQSGVQSSFLRGAGLGLAPGANPDVPLKCQRQSTPILAAGRKLNHTATHRHPAARLHRRSGTYHVPHTGSSCAVWTRWVWLKCVFTFISPGQIYNE